MTTGSAAEPLGPADFADGLLDGPAWEAWRSANPELAAEVVLAQRVRALLAELRTAEIAVPEGFEARLLERVREDATLLDLLELGVAGLGRVLLELLSALFSLAPAARPA